MEHWDHVHALLLAGGKGTRFWPLSREDHPKQLLKLFSDRTLVEDTYDRIRPIVPNDRVLVATSRTLSTRLMALFPDIPETNFIVEPLARNTAPCIAVAARRCLERDPDAILAVLPSDHYIADPNMFLEVLESAVTHAGTGEIVTLGITPTHPETGYGYIRFGEFREEPADIETSHRARGIQAFVEKPDHETAISYLKAGRYLWNSGIFIMRADTILEKVKLHLPGLYTAVDDLFQA
ncbi:MAG: mannose-1-phosphate guanylyltransferase, partial [Deltaproteobacteria bacterium]|nr:mannose-1-phosphate guanylyltransferase [Deltaproteobacteria bacterium]